MKLMLAANADINNLKFPVLVSPKLDGVRCGIYRSGGVVRAMSRTAKLIPNRFIQQYLACTALLGFDGELIVGSPSAPDVYTKTVSGVMSEDSESDFALYIFDYHTLPDVAFEKRLRLVHRNAPPPLTRVIPLRHVAVNSLEELLEYEHECLTLGYEGIMIRDPEGLYKYGRSTVREGGLLKLKRFEDSEAVILDVIELLHNHNPKELNELGGTKRSSAKAGKVRSGLLGAFRVRDVHTKVEFEIGTGFTLKQRQDFFTEDLEGAVVKYKYLPVGVKDKPRHPVFLGFRDLIDL